MNYGGGLFGVKVNGVDQMDFNRKGDAYYRVTRIVRFKCMSLVKR